MSEGKYGLNGKVCHSRNFSRTRALPAGGAPGKNFRRDPFWNCRRSQNFFL